MKELGFGVGRAWFESQLCHLACQVALDRRLSHAQLQLPRLQSESDSPRFMAVVGTPQADVPEARGLVLTYRDAQAVAVLVVAILSPHTQASAALIKTFRYVS